MSMISKGKVFDVFSHLPIMDLASPFEVIYCYPIVYNRDGSPFEGSDFHSLVFVASQKYMGSDVMEALSTYGTFSARWVTDLWEVWNNGR